MGWVFLRWAIVLLCGLPGLLWAETGKILVQVQDAQEKPVSGIEIGLKGRGGSKITGSDGKMQLAVGTDDKEGDWVLLHIVHSPPGREYEIISPWDYRAQIPSFKEKSENYLLVMVGRHGDRAQLTNRRAIRAFAEKINEANAPKTAGKQSVEEDPKVNLKRIAKQYGLTPEDVDAAIRQWGMRTTDPYEAGLAALYERNYAKATLSLQESLLQREAKLAAAQKDVGDTAFFLGQSLYEQGSYRESAVAYRKALDARPDNAGILNDLGRSLSLAGDYAGAEPFYRRALVIAEKALGPEHPLVATALSNLAVLLQGKADYTGAEPLYRQALAIDQKALGPEHQDVARDLNNLGSLLYDRADYAEAEPLIRQALAIAEKTLGPEHPSVAIGLNNLAALFNHKGDYERAEPLIRQALAIDEKALGPRHPDVASDLNGLAGLLWSKGDYAGAEPLYRRALAIDEKALGPEHPRVALDLNGLARLLWTKGDNAGAEPLARRALTIDEKALGPEHPTTLQFRKNLADLLATKKK
jgi:tetratricopeptide (TPR) repeat protein